MEIADLRKKTHAGLMEDLKKTREELEKTVISILQKKEKNVKKAGFIKKDIARILTVLNEKNSSTGSELKEEVKHE